MTYLIITIVIAALISPFMVLKPSPRQKTILKIRKLAKERGLQVQVMAQVVSDQEGLNPTSIRYFVPWLAKDLERAGSRPWLLLRDRGRGAYSLWQGWRWHGSEAPDHHQQAIDKVMVALPNGVNGISLDDKGLGFYWQELGSEELVDEIAVAIKIIYRNIIEL